MARAIHQDGGPGKRPRERAAMQGATRKPGPVAAARKPSAWLNRILVLLGVGVVLVAGTQACITLQAIPVRHIVVTGELEHTQAEAVQDMVQPALAGGFLRADLNYMRRQLEDLPWIYRASVRRKWPSALEIHVVEQLPIARWGRDGFLNHEGEVFRSAGGDKWQSLPLLRGPDGSTKSLVARYQRLVELLAPLGLAVEQVQVDQRGQVQVVLVGGIELLLGGDAFLERMHRFVALYRTELASRAAQVARVDLRYASGVAVAFRDASQVAGSSVAMVVGNDSAQP